MAQTLLARGAITVVICSHANGSFKSHRAGTNFGTGRGAPPAGRGTGVGSRVARRGPENRGAAVWAVQLAGCSPRGLPRRAAQASNAGGTKAGNPAIHRGTPCAPLTPTSLFGSSRR